jgi:hypothetical protein
MKPYFFKFLMLLLLASSLLQAQNNNNGKVFKAILERYYKTEKPVYKGRSQLLYLYCNQANNNEEIFEAIRERKLPDDFLKEMRKTMLTDLADKDWSAELQYVYEKDKTNLKQKISECLTLEKYHEVSRRLNLNNQRLMIVSKPLYYSKGNIALVKVVFYRNIEHNNGAILLLEKSGDDWQIKEYLNQWST